MRTPSAIRIASLSVTAILLSLPLETHAFQPPTRAPLPNFDQRSQAAAKFLESPEQAKALAELRGRVPKLKVEFDPIIGSPRLIAAPNGFLSGPSGSGKTISPAVAATLGKDEPHRATKAFLKDHANLFGHGPDVLAAARVKREFTTAHNGLKTVVWEQQVDGIPVFEGVLISHTTAKEELVNLSSQFVPNADEAANQGTPGRAGVLAAPPISAARAVALAAANLGEETAIDPAATAGAAGADQQQKFSALFLRGESEAKLIWVPMNKNTLRLCWDVVLTIRLRPEMYRVLVDAQSGAVIVRRCLTDYISDATYRVFTSDSPSPFSPGHPTPLTNQPPLIARTLVTLPALDTNASPNGWIDDGVNETRGNNVDAHTDLFNHDSPDLPRPAGSPFRVFDFPMDLTLAPSTYSPASVVQLFYVCNWMHDKLYELGFTEAAGNFQNNNFGRGGAGNDAVQADAQDGGGTDNANMSTPPDGSPPRMQMYVFSGPNPQRDGDLDVEIVLHEYTHGLSNRRVGGGVGISALQSAGMGEGWSDWYGLTLLSESGDDVNANYAAGGYATYQFLSPAYRQNYYFGIRRYPYSTDLTKNPLTFKDIDPGQASSHGGIPINPVIGGGGAAEVHNQGEVWCVTLWEARANLINKHGFSIGNQLILQLVTDGMNLSPANPNFLEARDAIIQADLVDTGGANRNELWAAFAKRGMGANATSPESFTTVGVFESYDLPDDLSIVPAAGFVASGPVGGPFTPDMLTFTLTNNGTAALNWTLANTSAWLNVSPSDGGTLAPGGPAAQVTAGLNGLEATLPMGIYSSTVRFTNLTSGVGAGRDFVLRVGQPDYFTELFNGDNDLAYSTITFTPDGSSSFYAACRDGAANFPTDPAGGSSLFLSDDSYAPINLAGGNTVGIYSRRSNVLFIGSNGYLTMDDGDGEYSESAATHFYLPRVAALFDDLNPEDGGTLSWKQLSNRVAVTWQNMPEYGTGNANSFQIEMFFDGRIRITYLALAARDGLAGLSGGEGVPFAFQESDLSSYGSCATPLLVSVPPSATEGAGLLAGQGRVMLTAPLATNLLVNLTSSDTNEVTVPSSVNIPAGQTNAAFDLTIVNDADLDGTQTAVITAEAPGFSSGTAKIAVHDNETATLQVSVPATVTEGGTITQGVVRVSAAPAANVIVQLASSDTSEIQVPASVLIPAGQTSVVFTVTVVDDTQIDGPQAAALTAHVQNWTDGYAAIVVLDNESLNLTVTLPASAGEAEGVWPNGGRVSLAGTLPTNLTVRLFSSDTSELLVPATVSIPAGQFFANFNLTLVDDPFVDGAQNVTVTASAAGFANGFANISVLDDESPPVPSNPSPSHLATNVPADADLAWRSSPDPELIVNGGFETGTLAGWTVVNTGNGNYAINDGTFVPASGDGPLPPFAGGFNAVTDQTEPGTRTIYQDVTLPAGGAPLLLHWSHRIRNHGAEFATNQSYRAEIQNLSGTVLAVAYSTQPGDSLLSDWVERSFDLAPYRGQTVRIAFIEEDNIGYFNLHLDNVSIRKPSGGPITNDVYFGTSPTPGAGQFLGTTTNTSWLLPTLAPQTTYYWQVVARRVGTTPGPVWQFTTRGVDHLDFSTVPSPQSVNQPFAVTITARDELNRAVTNFTGPVRLAGFTGSADGSLFTENFEDGAWDGWNNDGGIFVRAVTNDTAADGVYSFTLIGGTDSHYNGISHSLSNITPDRVQFHVRAATTTLAGGYVVLGGAPNTSETAVFFYMRDDGSMGLHEDANGWHGTPYAANQWYKVDLFFDWTNRVVDYYVEDALVEAGIPFRGPGVSDLTTAYLYNYHSTQNWWDEIRFTEGGLTVPVAITPTNSGNFSDGVWTGNITVLEPATNMFLVATDPEGHRGLSTNFDVRVVNDLSVTMVGQPEPVAVGGFLTNTITVINSGPAAASGVTATNFLPPSVAFISAVASQGGCVLSGGRVECALGGLAGGATGTVTIVTKPMAAGTITNLVNIGRTGVDGYAGNNVASTATRVTLLHHLAWGAIASTQYVNIPFPVTITARNFTNGLVTNFTGPVTLDGVSGSNGVLIVPTASGVFTGGIWNGDVTILAGTGSMILRAQDSDSFFGLSNPFLVSTNCPPAPTPMTPVPANGATNILASSTLSWSDSPLAAAINSATFNLFGPPPATQVSSSSQRARRFSFIQNGVALDEGVWIEDSAAPAFGAAPRPAQAFGSTVINFDDLTAPCGFSETTRLTNRYAASGITFAGPGGNDGAAIVDQCGNWSVSGYSPPNFLGFNTQAAMSDGGIPRGPETMYFNPPVSQISMLVGSGSGGGQPLTAQAFNSANVLISSTNVPLVSFLSPLTLSGAGIARVMVSTAVDVFVIDDVSFNSDFCPVTYDVYLSTNNPPTSLVGTGLSSRTYNPGPLSPFTTYYWRVVAHRDGSDAIGPIWSFTSGAPVVVTTLDHFTWSPILSPKTANLPFTVGIQARDFSNRIVTNYTGAVALSATTQSGLASNSILPSPVHNNSGSGNFTLGNSFTPNTNITVTAVRHYFGTKVSIWTDAGVLLATRPVVSVPGTWVETPLTTPLQLTAGTRYRVASYTGGGSYYYRGDGASTFPDGTIDQSYETGGDGFPTVPDGVRWWFVDLRYNVGVSTPVSMTPETSGAFSNGLWSGSVTVLSPGTNVVLRADNGAGRVGQSNPFHVVASNQAPIILAQPASQEVLAGAAASFAVSVFAATPVHYQWRLNGVDLPGRNNASWTLSGVSTNQAGQYSVEVTNLFGSVVSSNATLTVIPLSAVVAVFDNPVYVDTTSGGVDAESDNVQATIQSLGFTVATFTNLVAAAGTYQRILIPEQEFRPLAPDLTPSMRFALSNFVYQGGTLVVHGEYQGRGASLLNALFAFSVQEFYNGGVGSLYTRSAEADGTEFADDPSTIPQNDATTVLLRNSLPPGALNLYTNNNGSAVVGIELGSGLIVFLGWDWYNAAPTGSQNGGWLNVLESALRQGPLPPRPPTIVSQPASQTVRPIDNVVLSVQAFGSTPLAYQWRRDGTNLVNGGRISGALSPVLNIANAVGSDSGIYSVVVTNAAGRTTSSNAVLVVSTLDHFVWLPIASPQITGLPFTVTIEARNFLNGLATDFTGSVALSARGKSADDGTNSIVNPSFENGQTGWIPSQVGAYGNTINSGSYGGMPTHGVNFWYFFTYDFSTTQTGDHAEIVQMVDMSALSGLVFDAALFAPGGWGNRVKGEVRIDGVTVWSQTTAGIYTNQSVDLSAYAGSHLLELRSEVLSGGTFGSQWVMFDNLRTTSGIPIPISPANTGNFTNGLWSGNVTVLSVGTNVVLRADNGAGRTAQSNPFHVAASNQPPILLTQPASQQVLTGATVNLSVSVYATPPISYQWRFNGVDLLNKTNASLTLPGVADNQAGQYSVEVTNLYGSTTSAVATLTVVQVGGVVAYFSDNNPSLTGPEEPILAAGFAPLRITDISTYNLNSSGILFIDEVSNGALSSALLARLPQIQSWVNSGGKLIVHDRSAGNLNPNPFLLGYPASVTTRFETADIDVIPPGNTLVTAGPFGLINNVNLDGGGSSAHGYVAANQLPLGTEAILNTSGTINNVVSFSYGLGQGYVYYSSIPLDCYLANGGCDGNPIALPLRNIYTPNVLVYMASLVNCLDCPPNITAQPVGQTVRPGTSVSFSVRANGTAPLTYQWRRNGTNLINGGRISGVRSNALTISSSVELDSGLYSVFITNAYGNATSSNAVLLVSALDHFTWSPVPSPQTVDRPFAVTIQARDSLNRVVTNFAGSVALSAFAGGGATSNSILPSPLHDSVSSGSWTLGYSFTPSTNITVTAVRHYFGTKVSIWTDAGMLLAAQPVSSVPGTWVETPLAIPVELTAGTRYRVATYTGGGNYYYRGVTLSFPNGTIDQSYESSGDSFPANPDSTGWLVDLRYTVGQEMPLPVTPAISGNFTNGVWSDNVTVLSPATNAILRADFGAQRSGQSNPFHVVLSNQPPILMTQPASQVVLTGATANFAVSVFGVPPFAFQWRLNGGALPGATNASLTLTGVNTNQSGNYSVVVTNLFGSVTSSNAALTVVPVSSVVAVFDDPTYVDTTSGGVNAGSDNVQATVQSLGLGLSVITFTDLIAAAGTYRTILIPAQQFRALWPDLSPGTQTALSNFVYRGGRLIVHGTPGGPTGGLLNTVFGFSVQESSSSTGYFARTAQATGTEFADDPSSIPYNYIISVLQPYSFPPNALNIYSNAYGSAVTLFQVGTGAVAYVGWDWYDAAPLGSRNGGWLNVLASALRQGSLPPRPPVIVSQPLNQYAYPGNSIYLSVQVSGTTPLTYRWRRNGVNLIEGGRISGATSAYLNIFNSLESDSGLYSVLVTNAFGMATSAVATVTVSRLDHFSIAPIPSPEVTNQPFAVTVEARDQFNVLVTNFQGTVALNAYRQDTGNPVAISPTNSGTFTLGVWNGSARVLQVAPNVVLYANDGIGHYGYSTPFNVLSSVPLTFTMHPTNQTVLPGTNVTIHAAAIGTGLVRYQWRFEGTNIPSATNASHSFSNAALTHLGNYSVLATDNLTSLASSNAFLYVLVRPGFTMHPSPQTVLQGQTAIFSIIATGAPPLTYRWLRNGANWLSNAAPTLVITNCQTNGSFRCQVANPAGNMSSLSAALTVLVDNDRDGMADAWEAQYGFNTNNAADALFDFDGDGMINRDEYLAGTIPTDVLSVLKLTLTTTNTGLLQFVAQTNLAYTMQYRTNLDSLVWLNLTTITAQSQVRTVQVNAPNPPPEALRFYRVVTPPAP